jgi:hypothetical protein
MTQFNQIELIYNQILNLTNEIAVMIENEEYDIASTKLQHKDKLVGQLSIAKKTVNFTAKENLQMQAIEKTIKEKNDTMLADLQKLKVEVASELNATKTKVKLSSAYDHQADNRQGDMIDISE